MAEAYWLRVCLCLWPWLTARCVQSTDLSGEDPTLGKVLVQPVIKGIQQNKVVANAKHYVLNNEESNRMGVSENADERTRFEMYYPPVNHI